MQSHRTRKQNHKKVSIWTASRIANRIRYSIFLIRCQNDDILKVGIRQCIAFATLAKVNSDGRTSFDANPRLAAASQVADYNHYRACCRLGHRHRSDSFCDLRVSLSASDSGLCSQVSSENRQTLREVAFIRFQAINSYTTLNRWRVDRIKGWPT